MDPLARPDYGKRLMPAVLDELAASNPQKLYATIPQTSDLADGFRDITVADMARGVNSMAEWIDFRSGRSSTFETVAYIGIPDLRGVLVWFAAIKCGYKLLVLSPRNPPRTNAHLMGETGSKLLLHAAEIGPLVTPLKTLAPEASLVPIPSFNDLLQSDPPQYPFHRTFAEARDDPILILHSSGSTGLPKPITTTHGSYAVLDNEKNLPDIPGRKRQDWSLWNFEGEARVYSVYPFFHFGGIVSFALNPVFNNASPVLGPPMMMPDGNLLKHIMLHYKLRALIVVPAIAEQLLNEPNGLELIKNAEFLCYAGAPFNPASGNRIAEVVDLISPYGATEFFPLPELMTAREDWEYHEFHPLLKHEMREYDPKEGTYELVVFANESNRDTAALHHNLPGVSPEFMPFISHFLLNYDLTYSQAIADSLGRSEYRTKDLFTRHPDPNKSALYRFYGRRDDIIVLANGEKFNPIPFEMSLQNHPSLSGVFVIGNDRTQAAVLVEPSEPLDEEGEQKLREELWPVVQKSNALVPGQGRILNKGKILLASRDKPFKRSSKNTIIRRLSEEAYKDETDRLYSKMSPSATGLLVTLDVKKSYELTAVVKFVRTTLVASFPRAAEINDEDDLLANGLDSIQTLEIVSNLKRNLQAQTQMSVSWITPRTIFQNSTVKELSNVLWDFLNGGNIPESDSREARARVLDDAVGRYTKDLPRASPPLFSEQPPKATSVAVLGSTGFVGSYLMANLLRNPEVSSVYCLNRSDARKRQEASLLNIDKGLQPLFHKLEYLTIEIGRSRLGLPKDQYETLAASVNAIVYNAWKLDFGLTLRSFEPFLQTTRDLVELSVASKQRPHIVFIGSLGAIAWLTKTASVPEAPIQDSLAPINIGYAQAKLAAERILTFASQHCGVAVSVVRLGQVGGPLSYETHGWTDQPWISSIVRTSKTLKCAPSAVGRIDWVPVEPAATLIHDVAVHPTVEGGKAQFFHLVAPDAEPWTLFVDIMRDKYGVSDAVPLLEWCRRLRDVEGLTADDVASMPALKMLDYYEEVGGADLNEVKWVTGNSASVSDVVVPHVTKEMLESWLGSLEL